MQTSQIITASAVTAVALTLAYALYFDHRRRHDADFRKSLARERRKHARAQKAEVEAEVENQKSQLRAAVMAANEEGYPEGVEEREAYFMNEVAMGESLLSLGETKAVDAALCFYKALKVYPDPPNLIGIYEKTVPKHVLDILGQAIALGDSSILSSEPIE
ncbi:hypothetical protein TWF173_003006 [Orbilia oligospora]|uniref:Mitochondrial import receptor subunit TOM20 n=2 Tax=Orbilia oligospora TaxID=2813651 RepID=G1XIE7_ARTOA|nr:hypothetical protein AOL_s00097g124 [Orbilia oligospora ATCC 24927]EGX47078.1 hypothetical protein AOL_s00097g124 [Orbilia oligospora ATCC 24927]KAF3277991.1 hypothetical protein TWF970_004871 [Orbilia oligospora]KAF3315810.1 hypothetical protein TWF173_003006 [Orbilia oligospora]